MNSIKSVFNNTFWNGEAYYYETSNELPDDRAQAIPVMAQVFILQKQAMRPGGSHLRWKCRI